MTRSLPSALYPLLLFSCVHSCAQEMGVRFPLKVTQVAQLLVAAGVQVDPTDISYTAQLTSSVATPQLTIAAVNLADSSHLRIRVTCYLAGQCLPFFTVVDLHDSQRASLAKSLLVSNLSPALTTKPSRTTVLHAGEPAVLLLENLHMQIKIPVVTIDTGQLGAEVRVASLDRKQTYRAVVADSGFVRGTLP